jgi:hypothetical protein
MPSTADRIAETLSLHAIMSISQLRIITSFRGASRIEELRHQVGWRLSTLRWTYPLQGLPLQHQKPPPSRHHAATTSCWYLRRFGARAQNCTHPCAFQQQRKPVQPAAHVCTAATGRLFITDKFT